MPKNEDIIASPDWHPVSLYGASSAHVERASSGGSRRGLQDRDSNHRGIVTDTRTERASEIELSALNTGSRVVVWTAGRHVYEERPCVWPISGDR